MKGSTVLYSKSTVTVHWKTFQIWSSISCVKYLSLRQNKISLKANISKSILNHKLKITYLEDQRKSSSKHAVNIIQFCSVQK